MLALTLDSVPSEGHSQVPMAAFLDTFERVAPQLDFYPQWAKVFFMVTLVLVAMAVVVF